MLRSLFVLSIACIVPCVGLAFVDSPPPAPEASTPADATAEVRAYLVQVTVTEKEGDVTKGVGGATLSVQEGYEFSYVAGETVEEMAPGVIRPSNSAGKVLGTDGTVEDVSPVPIELSTDFFSGTTIRGSVGKPNSGLLPVSMRCKVGKFVETGNPQIKAVGGQFVDVRLNAKPGEKLEFRIHDKTWCEITVEQLPRTEIAQPSKSASVDETE